MSEEVSGDGYARSGIGEEWPTLYFPLTDEEFEEQTKRMFYKLEGWEKFWPYDKRPQWLRVKYP